MLDSPSQKKTVKVGILGDKYVGKTYLAHTFTGLNYQGYKETTTVSQFQSQDSQQATKFIYVDNPALDNQYIASIGRIYQFDVLVFLFKDCDSFTKLFEFFESIKQTLSKQSDPVVKYYWSHPKKIVAAYSNFQSTIVVQLQQLFNILIQEIILFCKQAKFHSFILEKQLTNWQVLKAIIQEQPIVKYMNQEIPQIAIETQNVSIQKQQNQKQIQKIEQIEQIKKQQIDQYQERAELLSQQRSQVVIITSQPHEKLNLQGEATKQNLQVAELTKQIETASAEVISSEKSQSQSQINSQQEKNRQSFLTAQNLSKGIQVQKQQTKNPKRSLIQVKRQMDPTQQIKMKTQQVKIEHQDQSIENNQLRKERISKLIKDSFYGSSMSILTDQIRKSKIQEPVSTEEIKQVQEPKKQTKQQHILSGYKQQKGQTDSQIDLQLRKLNESKNEKLQDERQSSQVQNKQVKKQQRRKSSKKNRESLKKNQDQHLKKETKQLPQSQFSKSKKIKKQKQLSKQPKNCQCKII